MIRTPTAIPVLALLAAAQAALAQGPAPKVVPVDNYLPPGVQAFEIAIPSGGHHVYHGADGQIWLYDRDARKTTRLADGIQWDLNVAANGSAMAFTRAGEESKTEFVWTIPLDARTGLATGPARRVSTIPGGTPAISPDGKRLAFARDDADGESLVVLPLVGGPEKTLASFTGTGIGSIGWTPDSKTIYVGVNPPRANRRDPGSILRVDANGGKPAVVISATGNAGPGLAPNGQFILYEDPREPGRIVATDTAGHRIGGVALMARMFTSTWLPDSRLLVLAGGKHPAVKTYALADGRSRVLVDSFVNAATPRWSPDGKQVAFVRRLGVRTQLVVTNGDGGRQRSYLTQDQVAANPPVAWSPDGKWIAYQGSQTAAITSVNAVELSTGREVKLASVAGPRPYEWSRDARHVYVSVSDVPAVNPAIGPPPASHHVRLLEIGLDGTSRTLKDTTLGGYGGLFVSPNGALIARGDFGQPVTAAPIHGGSTAQLLPGDPGFLSVPAFSADGKWVAWRRNRDGNNNRDLRELDVVQLDGSHRITMTTPFAMLGGWAQAFLPGNQDVLVADSTAVYRLRMPNGTPVRLFDFNTGSRNVPQFFDLSPDGRTIVYPGMVAEPVTTRAVDFSPFLVSSSHK